MSASDVDASDSPTDADAELMTELRLMAEHYNLHDDEALAMATLIGYFSEGADAGGAWPQPTADEPWVRELLHFAAPAVAEAAVMELFVAWEATHVEPFVFLSQVEAVAPRGARANLRWITAKAHERLAHTLEAEAALQTAQDLDPDCWLACFDLARYAADRGHAERALTLLRRAAVPLDDPQVLALQAYLPAAHPELGRNDPCWCGSGRKFKACHLGKDTLPLAQRALWLHHKARTWLNSEDWFDEAMDLVEVYAGIDLPAVDHVQFSGSALIQGALLFEDHAFEQFLAERGPLLPADELAMGQAWLTVRRSVFEVLETSPTGLRVKDRRSGEVLWIANARATVLEVGMLFSTRFFPVEDHHIGLGGYEPVDDDELDSFLAALEGIDSAAEWLAFVAARLAEEPEQTNQPAQES